MTQTMKRRGRHGHLKRKFNRKGKRGLLINIVVPKYMPDFDPPYLKPLTAEQEIEKIRREQCFSSSEKYCPPKPNIA